MRPALDLFLLLLIFFSATKLQAQTAAAASASPENAEQVAIATYRQAMGEEAHLFSGSEFISYPVSVGEHQFFLNKLLEASLVYDGLTYERVPIFYDIVNDDVIVGRHDEFSPTIYIKVHKNKITQFKLDGHTFIHIQDNSTLAPGFYEQLYSGNLQVLAKRKKVYKKEVVTVTFPADNYYYLLKAGTYFPVKSKGSVLKVLKEHKKELSQYLKANNIIFSQNREFAIAKLAEQYDLLTQAK
ncbi:hypothetical protein [uncultured Pontibacter sp.]|uniref:hypothetical protein n=1 Tax=uncultured Pontibacter sp. TaxID=453356 RepID=UPI002616532E|nr:hypothetical protein [uncultured Pontibacter sp.]